MQGRVGLLVLIIFGLLMGYSELKYIVTIFQQKYQSDFFMFKESFRFLYLPSPEKDLKFGVPFSKVTKLHIAKFAVFGRQSRLMQTKLIKNYNESNDKNSQSS